MQIDCTIIQYLCSMKSISFKNFRRFADFPEFKFGDITILVGGNNAGKSTLVKALLLILDNLKNLKKKPSGFIINDGFYDPIFSFDADETHSLKLGTFGRSLFSEAHNQQMEFSLSLTNFAVSMTIEPDEVGIDLPVGKVAKIYVEDYQRHIKYEINFNNRRMRIDFEEYKITKGSKFDEIDVRLNELEDEIYFADFEGYAPEKVAEINLEIDKLKKVRRLLVENSNDFQQEATIEADFHNYISAKSEYKETNNLLASYIENFEAYTWTIGDYSTEEDRANEQVLGDKNSLLLESARALQSELRKPHVYYIQAHGVAQKMLYTIDDKNDFVAQAIHQYARCGIKSGQVPDVFIKRWMQEFGIGQDYEIKPIGGEGYQVFIISNGRKTNLADMGMGTNQLMVLLFSLATIMFEEGHHGKDGGRSYIPKFIIIEEPEQNLHPRLQSKLADLILEVTKDPSYKFLIETHSEYLIRRTQVLVAEMGLEETDLEKQNPFKVYYFPEDGIPYEMKYLTSGRFENKFGEGFFDEASNSALTISKIERKKANV